VEENVLTVFNDMKVRKAHSNEEEKSKRKKAVLFCLSEDKKKIIMEEGQEILQGDEGDPYLKFVKMLPPKLKRPRKRTWFSFSGESVDVLHLNHGFLILFL